MIGVAEVEAARERIRADVFETPCLRSPHFSELLDAEILFKCEGLQRTGSFKPRGALHKLLRLPEAERARGVIAASAGNHAQGVAFAAARVGVKATIVMPETTPLVKISQTQRWGAEVTLYGENLDEAFLEARRLQEAGGFAFVHPFDDDDVIAGQGTAGLEILEQVGAPDLVVVPIGGGGLISGISTVMKARSPATRVVGVQCESAPSMHASFRAGELTVKPSRRTLAEGIAVKRPGERTWAYVRDRVDDVVLVSEAEIEETIFRLLEIAKLSTEGAGAAAAAAVLHGHVPEVAGKKVVIVLSGANIDMNILSRLIERALVRHHRFARLRLDIQDRPGALARILAVVAEHGANVLRIEHERFFSDSSIWETAVELTLETRDREQVEAILADLREGGLVRVGEPGLDLVAAPILPGHRGGP